MPGSRTSRVLALSCTLAIAAAFAGCKSCGDGPPSAGDDAGGDATTDAGASDQGTDAPTADMAMDGFEIASPEDGATIGELQLSIDVLATPWADQSVATTVRVDGVDVAEQDVAIDGDGRFSTTLDVSDYDGIGRPIALSVVIDDQSTEPVSVVVDRRPAALADFRDVAAEDVVVRWHGDMPRILGANVEVEGDDPVQKMFDFLDDWAGLLGLQNTGDQFAPERMVTDETGMEHVTFRQHFGGYPVQGGRVVASFDGNRLVDFSGNYLRRSAPVFEEQVSRETAELNARRFIPSDRPFLVGTTRRIVRDRALFHPRDESSPTLVWRVTFRGLERESGRATWRVYVDAATGEVMDVVDQTRTAADDLVVIEAAGKKSATCWRVLTGGAERVCTEDGCDAGANAESNDVFDYTNTIWDYFDNRHNWESWNGNGKRVRNVVDWIEQNAAWSSGCKVMKFGTGWATRDVHAHEFGHAIGDGAGANFIYEGESGALDEAVADIYGALIDGEAKGIGFDPEIGEGTPQGRLRFMADPPRQSDPDVYGDYCDCGSSSHELFTSEDEAPDPELCAAADDDSPLVGCVVCDRQMCDPTNCPNDCRDNNGREVHSNSGIANKAAYLLAEGGEHSGASIRAIGVDKLERILFAALKHRLHKSSDFDNFGWGLMSEARRFEANGMHGFSGSDVCQVRDAMAAIGVTDGDADCDGILDSQENDADDDSIADANDNCTQQWNSGQSDQDGDGIGDICDPDLDDDGALNFEDNCPRTANAPQTDDDDNGRGDACEDQDFDGIMALNDNCPETYNRDQLDSDNDMIGDRCDDDRDGDGEPNATDNCPDVSNSDQMDVDGDGAGDVCDDEDGDGLLDGEDACPETYDPGNPDRDNDGLVDACQDDDDDNDGEPDNVDNCPTRANGNQGDEDDDGVGDLCDNCPVDANPQQTDSDGDFAGDACDIDADNDGRPNAEDNCPTTDNPRQVDSDGDGDGDACEFEMLWEHLGGVDPQSFLVNLQRAADFAEGGRPVVDTPLPICRDDCPDYLSDGYGVEVEVSAPFEFGVAILDGRGDFVAFAHPDELTTAQDGTQTGTVHFEPSMGAWFRTDAAQRGVFQGETYHLEIGPTPEAFAPEIREADVAVNREDP